MKQKLFSYTFFLSVLLIIISGCDTTSSISKATATSTNTKESVTETDFNINTTVVSDRGAAKVEALLSEMTITEKIGQLNLLTPGGAVTGAVVSKDVEEKIKNGNAGGIFGIRGADKIRRVQEMAVNESRLKIPLIVGLDVIHGHQTIFPIPLGLSCTWDMELIEQTARQAAREATADGIMWNFSPMVDIARDPRWGRIAEGAGEDPFLGAKIAKAMVVGYQGSDFKDPTTMLACVKHFALYGAAEGGRDYATTDMSKMKMYNEYLPPYKAAVESGVASVMTSFNTVDYMPASGSAFLFEDLLRKQWGFKGFVVTDYSTINEMINHGLGDIQEVSKISLKAGVDMDMVGEGFLNTIQKSLTEGKITSFEIENACRRILIAKEKLGLFEDPFRYCDAERASKEILSKTNRAFARKVAGDSFVLLKNDNNLLPLNKSGKIAVIGPLTDSRRNMLGTWSVSGDHDLAVTVIEGIKNVIGNQAEILYAKGANISDDPVFAKRVNTFGEEITIDKRTPEVMIEEALHIAQQSEVIIAVMGEAADMSGESSSMADIGLQPSQKRLLKELVKTGKPIVLVLYNGRPMTLGWEAENMDAILDVWFGGTEGGNAVADVLFGDVNPGGKLTTSFPVHVGQVPVYHSMLNSGRPDQGTGSKFQSNYLDIPNQPLYPFGFGLSYTSFEYGKIKLSETSFSKGNSISASVLVTNTGEREGAEVVQLYIRDVVGSISRPMKELKGFQKIKLKPGESKEVQFTVDEELLKFYNSNLEFVAEPGAFELFIGTNSVETQKASFTLN
jgi:beta-glucosidase